MRSDMIRVLVTRGRGVKWHTDRVPREKNLPLESLPKQESMRRNRGMTRHFGDHLGPMRRFLNARVGQPWDDVYSEIRQNLNARGTMHAHLLGHLEDMVAKDVHRVDGVLMHCNRWGSPTRLYWSHWCAHYICPDTARLKRIPTHLRWRR